MPQSERLVQPEMGVGTVKLTVRDLLALKGRRKFSMTNAADYNTAKAAEQAGIDIISGRGLYNEEQMCLALDQLRQAAPNTLIACNMPATVAYVSDTEAIRCAMAARDHGADLIYSSGNTLSRFKALADLGIPCVGHVGLVPIRATWLGGLRPVGKTIEEAVRVYRDTIAFQDAGVIAVEMESVPGAIAAEITRRMSLLTISLGSGRDCDGQFVFSCDLLGTYEPRYPGLSRPYDGPYPRHAKKYADLYGAAVEAFGLFRHEIESGAFPADRNTIRVDNDVLAGFTARISESEQVAP